MTQTTVHHTPAATITHTTVLLVGGVDCDVTVYHARTPDVRIVLRFGTAMMTLYSADTAQGLLEAFAAARAAIARLPRQIPAPATGTHEPVARTALAIEWTRRPGYSVVAQSAPNKTRTAVVHWVDLHCGPLTFQIRDQAGLHSTVELLTRVHRSAVAVCLDGPEHAADPTAEDYRFAP